VPLDLPCRLEALPLLAAHAERFATEAALPASGLFALQLCLEEAVSNVIRHGGLADTARVGISLRCEDGMLVAEITDRGNAFDPRRHPGPPPSATLETASVGGRGVALMRRFCPDISYDRREGTNRLRLAFPLHPGPG
jgi:anti-sigma regulatory factor (Ser/Thr protein kinase)